MKKVLIIDTSVLCVWLNIPGMDTCGPENDKWDMQRVQQKIEKEQKNRATFVLPLATILETGNHIAKAPHSRKEKADELGGLMKKSAEEETPWAAFSEQSALWVPEKLKKLAETWPQLSSQKLSIGDATIKDVADYYSQMGFKVEILTGDKGLKTYEPAEPELIPRRRKK